MQEQLKTVCTESKGKGSSKASSATEELQFLMDFSTSITQAAAKTMERLTEFVFISMGNLTLACRDAITRVHPRRPLLQKNCSFSWTLVQV